MSTKENPAGLLLKVSKNMAGADIKKMIENYFKVNEGQRSSLSPNGRMQKTQESDIKAVVHDSEKVGTSIDSSINRNSFGNVVGQNSSSTPQASFTSGQKRESHDNLPAKYLSPSVKEFQSFAQRNPYDTGDYFKHWGLTVN